MELTFVNVLGKCNSTLNVMVVQESLHGDKARTEAGLTWNSCHQPTLPAGPTSTTTVLYVDSVPHREKDLASTSFRHMRAFNSLSRALRLSQVCGRTGLKTSYE